MIFLVRHAHAGARSAWPGSDGERPLSAQGEREAEAVAVLLAGRPVAAILSSPRERCLATMAPLAAARGLPVREDPRLDELAPPGRADALLASAPSGTVLCTHRPVIAHLLKGLSSAGVDLDSPGTAGCGSVWELTSSGGRIVSGRYRPSPV